MKHVYNKNKAINVICAFVKCETCFERIISPMTHMLNNGMGEGKAIEQQSHLIAPF